MRPLRVLAPLALAAPLAIGGTSSYAGGAADPCSGWTLRTVLSGLGSLENVEPDGHDGVFVSRSADDAVERVRPDLTTEVVAGDVVSPGGLRLRGTTLWFNQGDAAPSGALGTADGSLQTVDVVTGERHVVATGLTMPNGLVLDDAGNAYTSRDVSPGFGVGHGSGVGTELGLGTGITEVAADGRVTPGWLPIDDANGMAIDPSGTWLYADQTFTLESGVYRVRLDDPSVVEHVADLGTAGVPKGLDDLTIDADGVLYLAANSAGEVIRLDPATGRSCVIVSGMTTTSAVKIGRAFGATEDRLYVVGFDGLLREATPPSGVTLRNPARGDVEGTTS